MVGSKQPTECMTGKTGVPVTFETGDAGEEKDGGDGGGMTCVRGRGQGRRIWVRNRAVCRCGFGFGHVRFGREIEIVPHPFSTRSLSEVGGGRVQDRRAGAPFFVEVIFIDDGWEAGGFSSFLLFVGFFVSLCATGEDM